MGRKRNGGNNGAVAEAPPVEAPQEQAAADNGQEKNQPVHRIRIRSVTGAIWLNSSDNGSYHTATYTRSYRDQQGNWHSTSSFNGPDSLLLAEVARACFHWIVNATQNTGNGQSNGHASPSTNGTTDGDSPIPF